MFYPLTVVWEEVRLAERYRAEYEYYRRETPLLIPRGRFCTGNFRWVRTMRAGGLTLLLVTATLLAGVGGDGQDDACSLAHFVHAGQEAGDFAAYGTKMREGGQKGMMQKSAQRVTQQVEADKAILSNSLDGELARTAGQWRRLGVLGLAAFALATCLVGLKGGPALGDHECINALAARQTLEAGDWLIPHLEEIPRIRKPPLASGSSPPPRMRWTASTLRRW